MWPAAAHISAVASPKPAKKSTGRGHKRCKRCSKRWVGTQSPQNLPALKCSASRSWNQRHPCFCFEHMGLLKDIHLWCIKTRHPHLFRQTVLLGTRGHPRAPEGTRGFRDPRFPTSNTVKIQKQTANPNKQNINSDYIITFIYIIYIIIYIYIYNNI